MNVAKVTNNKNLQVAITIIGVSAGLIAIWNFFESRKTKKLEKELKEMEYALKKHQIDTLKENGKM